MTPKETPAAKTAERFRFALPGPAILEPHASLRYVGKLFKALAVGLFLLLVAEIALGVAQDGFKALPLLLLEVAQLLLFTGLMWGWRPGLPRDRDQPRRAGEPRAPLATEHAAPDGDGSEGPEGRADRPGEPDPLVCRPGNSIT